MNGVFKPLKVNVELIFKWIAGADFVDRPDRRRCFLNENERSRFNQSGS